MATIPGVSPTELITSAWGNAVALELNTRTVKTDGSMPVTGPLVCAGSPPLKLRRSGDQPLIQFENTTGATVLAQILASATYMIYDTKAAAGSHFFRVNGVTVATIDVGGLTMAAGKTLESSGQVRGTQGRFGSTVGSQVVVADTNGGGEAALASIAFYPSATSMDALGARGAYVGYAGEGFQVQAGGPTVLQSTGGDVILEAGDQIVFRSAGGDRFLIDTAAFLAGKSASNLATAGVELYGLGSAAVGSMRTTIGTAGLQNVYARHVGAADASGQLFAAFTHGSGAAVTIGSITQNGTAGVAFNETSDYRLKDDHGPIENAVDRLKLLRPIRFAWKADPAAGDLDGFLAHEVAAAVPQAVTGERDAVYPASGDPAAPPAGTINPQQLDRSQLVPLLTAALLEVARRLDALEQAA
jgi:hypothetical protein